jgi:beta-lactamase regulating signal transducer with metallopeptidase domain
MMTTTTLLALKGLAILASATTVTVLLAKAPASLRHLVWTAALAAVLALPLVEASGVRLEVPVPAALLEAPREQPDPATTHRTTVVQRATLTPEPTATRVAVPPMRSRVEPVRSTRASTSAPAPRGWTIPDWTIPALWAAGVVALLALTLLGQLAAWRVTTRDVRPAPMPVRVRAARLSDEVGVRGPVRVVVSSTLRVPATWGFRTATVVLPHDHERWSPATLERVLLHELAHIRRRDCLTQLVGELARALHWPNPLAWLAVERQRLESERACDDRVLVRSAASDYAGDLVALVRGLKDRAAPRAALAMAEPAGVIGRVRAILDPRRARGEVGRAGVALAMSLAAAVAFAATGLVPVAAAQVSPPAPPAPFAPEAYFDAPAAPASTTVMVDAPDRPELPTPPAPRFRDPSGWRSAVAVALGLEPAVAPAPAQSQELCVFRGDGDRSSMHNTDENRIRVRWETDSCRVDIEIDGDIEFAADESDVVRMSSGALFEVEERFGSDGRRVRLDGERGGIERRYWVDGEEIAWGPEAQQWLAAILPEIFRHTTIDAEARVRRLLDAGGPERVFAEVELMQSDHVVRTYLELLMEHADLGDADYLRVIDRAGRIDSDHSTATLLQAVVERAGLRPAFQEPMLRAATSIDSDHQKAEVLTTLLSAPLTPEQLDAVVRAAQDIESDHQLAQVLSTVARQGGLTDAGRAAYMETLETIESDHQHAMVLETFLDGGRLTADELSQVLAMTRSIESDHQRATVLQRVARDYPLTGEEVTAYLRAASEIDSDHQLAATAEVIIERAEFTDQQLELVLAMTDGIESDHQRSMVLIRVIERRTLSAREIRLVLGVAADIGSDHQLSEVLKRVVEDEQLDADGVVDVLAVTGEVDSDHQRSTVMIALAERYELEGDALTRYHDLAESMGRHQRDQALAALARRPRTR